MVKKFILTALSLFTIIWAIQVITILVYPTSDVEEETVEGYDAETSHLLALEKYKLQQKEEMEELSRLEEEATKEYEEKLLKEAEEKAKQEAEEQAKKEAEEQAKKEAEEATKETTWTGQVLTKSAGAIMGPSGKETYYNLDMTGVISIMRSMGNTDEYWVRDDGVKMLGDYVMVAADFSIRPRGSYVETSLGTGIVCDTGGFAATNSTLIDIAVTW